MDIEHEDLKRAVLQAEIKHGDVVLRVLARLDADPDFRDAMVAAVMTKDPKAISVLAYGHFQPIEPRRNAHNHQIEPALPKLDAPVNAGQLVQMLNDRTLLVASRLLSNGAIDGAVTSWVKSRLLKLIDAVLGIEDDGYNRVRIWQNREATPVLQAIRARVTAAAMPAVEAALDTIDFTEITSRLAVKAHQEIKNVYDRKAKDYLRDRAKTWAADRARLDVDRLMNDADAQLKEDAA